MNWNNIPNEERLALWKSLRKDIADLAQEEKINSVSKFFAEMPFGSRSLDYYTPDSWPTPWDILFHGTFCKSSISLLMFYTLTLIPKPPNIELILVDDEDIFLLPIIDNQFVLNYELGKVSAYSEIHSDFKVLKQYSRSQIKNIT